MTFPVELLLKHYSICSLPSIDKKMENKKVGFEVLEGHVSGIIYILCV